jgi:O-antigen ligase
MMGVIGLVGSVVILALLTSWLKSSPDKQKIFWLFMGVGMLLYSLIPQFAFTIVGDPVYPGYAKGFEISILDVALASYLLANRGKSTMNIPFKKVMLFYFAVVIISIPGALNWRAGAFYAFQLLRMYLVYRAVAIATTDERNYSAFIRGLAIGTLGELLIVLQQRFLGGDIQPDGTFGHQNSLGLVSNLLLIASVGTILAGERSWSRLLIAGPAIMMSAITGSRGVTGFALIGGVLVYFHSLFHSASARKVKIGFIGAIAAAVLIPLAMMQLQARFEQEKQLDIGDETEYDERGAYIRAAGMMLQNYPLGVGANNFTLVANIKGYYEAAGVAPVYFSRNGIVHNIYWLTLGELGYPGIVALLALIILPIYKGLSAAIKYRGRKEAEVAGALTVSLAICYIHSAFEWLLLNSAAQYFLVVTLGLLVGRLHLLTATASAAIPVTTVEKSKGKSTVVIPDPVPAPLPATKQIAPGTPRRPIPRGLHR